MIDRVLITKLLKEEGLTECESEGYGPVSTRRPAKLRADESAGNLASLFMNYRGT